MAEIHLSLTKLLTIFTFGHRATLIYQLISCSLFEMPTYKYMDQSVVGTNN